MGSIEEIDARLQRIQSVFFPGMFDDADEMLEATRSSKDEPTCVERLAGPTRELNDAILEFVFFQDDALVTAAAIPELIPLLKHSNPLVAERAVDVVYKMSRKPAERAALIESNELAEAVVSEIK